MDIVTLALAKAYADKVASGKTKITPDEATQSLIIQFDDGTTTTMKIHDIVSDDHINDLIDSKLSNFVNVAEEGA